MGYRTEWDALAARIEGLIGAGLIVVKIAPLLQSQSDHHGVLASEIIPNGNQTCRALAEFYTAHASSLPPRAAAVLEDFLSKNRQFFSSVQPGFGALQAMLALLQSIRAEVTHLLADTEYQARCTVERAFLHLKRSIIVDEGLRKRWKAAFEGHETHCEKLGAVHLLGHGLWGFKVSATGAATDLVLGEALTPDDEVERASNALVLTEWKRLLHPREIDAVVAQARDQAGKYSGGVLGGVELRTYRYIVVVSEKDEVMPPDLLMGSVTYRHVNIPVSPKVPSKRRKSP
jgi:hypothetical protein